MNDLIDKIIDKIRPVAGLTYEEAKDLAYKILSLFPTPLTEEEVEKILPAKMDVNKPPFGKDIHARRIGYNQAIDDCKSTLIGKCGNNDNEELKAIKKIIANLDEFGHPIDPECELPLLATYVYGWIIDFYTQLCTAKNELSKALATPTFSGGEKEEVKPDYYDKGGCTSYTKGVDPEVTCWHCKKTFLCDCMDATCRLCGAPYAKERCKEFNFIPTKQKDITCKHGTEYPVAWFNFL